MASLADSQCDRAQRYHQIQGRSMCTVRSYLPPPPPALPSSAAVSENLTDSLVDFKRRELAAVGVGPSLSANSSAEHQELLEISRGFSDCSSFGSDISGELQRLAYFAISEVPRSVAASNVGSLEESWLSTSSESLEYASVEGVEPVVRACVEHLRSVSVEAKREAAARIRLLAKHRSDFRSLIGASGLGAISGLVPLLRSTDPVAQENAAMARWRRPTRGA